MTRMTRAYNSGFLAVPRMTNTTCGAKRSANASTGGEARTRLLKVPHERQTYHNQAHHNAINDKDFQAVRLKISNEPSNRNISNDCRNQHTYQKGHVHFRWQTLFSQFVSLKQRSARDEWRRQQEAKPHRSLSRHIAEQTGGNGRSRARHAGNQRESLRATHNHRIRKAEASEGLPQFADFFAPPHQQSHYD